MLDKNSFPQHIAFIMDGNGRWAKGRGLPRSAGHREGVERVKEIVQAGQELGVKVMTFYAFSAENWNRPKREIDLLMRYLDAFLKKEIPKLKRRNIRFLAIGKAEPVPLKLREKIREAELKTRENSGLTAVLALNYGARQEIVDAAKGFAADCLAGRRQPDGLDEQVFSSYLYTAGLPDPDLLIRSSGELRLSNFLLLQLSYAELYFAAKYWPDFHREDLLEAIAEFGRRERRFGRINAG